MHAFFLQNQNKRYMNTGSSVQSFYDTILNLVTIVRYN